MIKQMRRDNDIKNIKQRFTNRYYVYVWDESDQSEWNG